MKLLRFISAFLITVMLLSLMPLSAIAEGETENNTVYTGTLGSNVSYTIDSATGVCTISGTGSMSDYETINNSPLENYKQYISTVIIEEGITSIGDYVFRGCNYVSDITIPTSVTRIGEYAFGGCYNLASITIPEGVTTIEKHTFWSCTSLNKIYLPSTVTTVEEGAFRNCEALKEIVFQGELSYIGPYAFSYIDNLQRLIIPGATVVFDENVQKIFLETNTDNLTIYGYEDSTVHTYADDNNINFIPTDNITGKCGDTASYSFDLITGVLTITGTGEMYDYDYNTTPWAPYVRDITTVVIGEGITSVGFNDFDQCTAITTVSLPTTLQTIARQAFYGCESLSSIVIPEGVTSIGMLAFQGCTSLVSVSLPSTLRTIEQQAFCYDANISYLNIPNGVETIGAFAFYCCSSLANIVIPESVTLIKNDAFSGCTNLYEAYIHSRNVEFISTVFSSVAEGFTIYGYANSTAQTHAETYNINFVVEYHVYGISGDFLDTAINNTNNEFVNNGNGYYTITYENFPAGGRYVYITIDGVSKYRFFVQTEDISKITFMFNPTELTISRAIVYNSCIIHVKMPDSWGEVPYIYYWGGSNDIDWPGTTMYQDSGGWYKYELSGYQRYFIISNGNELQTEDLTIYARELWVVVQEDKSGSIFYGDIGDEEEIIVNFHTNGGSEMESIHGSIFSNVLIPAEPPVKEGYTFQTWYYIDDYGSNHYYEQQWPIVSAGTYDFYAAWEREGTYRVNVYSPSFVPYVHYWGLNNSESVWPGFEMTAAQDGWYYYDVPADSPFFIINYTDKYNWTWQTDDIAIGTPEDQWVFIEPGKRNPQRLDYDVFDFPNFINITYHTNGGDEVQRLVKINDGCTLTEDLLPTPKRDGYVFVGWYTDPQLTTPAQIDEGITADVELYAAWVEVGSVSIGANDPTANGGTASGFELYGAQIRTEPSMGLRFCTRVSSRLLADIKDITGEAPSYGYVLVRKDSMTSGEEVKVGAETVTGAVLAERISKNHFYSCADYVVYTACVLNIPLAGYDSQIAARPFIKYTDVNGVEQYYYYTEASSKNVGGAYYSSLYSFASYMVDNGIESEAYRAYLNQEIIGPYDVYVDYLTKGENDYDESEVKYIQ